ncbi:MAG TPA: PAS domain S-box protein [Candidatus Thermoplasmatota archaeon]|nr:PAS domain S-box protein [Candidatus Thermoplasmatota archaeon]
MDKRLSDKISEKQDIVHQLREDEKRGTFINNTSQSCSGMRDAQQGFAESKDDFFNSIKSNDDSQFKMIDEQEEMLYHSVVELFPDGIFVLDLKGIIQSCNASAVTLLGYSKEELIGKKIFDIGKFDETGIETYLNIFDSIIQGNIIDPFELKLQKKDKTLFTAEIRARVLTQNDKKIGIQVIARKINDIKIQEEKVKECKVSFQRIFSIIPDMISVHDKEMNIIYSNWKGFADIPEEKRILNTKCYNTYRGLDQICPDCNAGTVLNAKESIQKELELPEGVWVDLRVLPLVDENNDVELFVEWVRDITERKEVERKLQKIFDMSSDLICEADINTDTFTKINPAFTHVLGYSEEELLSKTFLDFVHPDDKKYTIQVIDEQLQKGEKVLTFINRYRCKDGSYVWLDWNSHPVPEEGFTYAIARDITAKKQAEIALKEREENYRRIFEMSPTGITTADKNGRIIDINQSGADITGHLREELIGKSYKKLHFIDNKMMLKIFKDLPKLLRGKSLGPLEIDVVDKEGNDHILEVRISPIHASGRFHGTQTTMHDVTEQRNAIKELRNSEEKYHTLFETMAEGVVYQDANGDIISANPAAEQILGLTLSQMQKRTSMDPRWKAVDKDKHELPGENHPAMMALQTGEKVTDFQMGIFNPEKNDYVWMIVNSVPQYMDGSDKPSQVYSTFLDVTDRVNAERKLKETLKATTDGIWIWNFKTNTLFFSDRYYRMLGYQPQEFKATFDNWINLIHPDDKEHALAVAQDYLKKKPDVYENSFRLKTKQGDYRWMRAKARVVQRDENGEAIRMIGNHEDITEKKEAEIKSKENEEKLKNLLKSSSEFIWQVDENSVYTYVSDGAVDVIEYEKAEIIGKTPFDFMDSSEAERVGKIFSEIAQKKEKIIRLEDIMVSKTGKHVIFETDAMPLFNKNNMLIGYFGICRDITDRKKIENTVIENEKKFRHIVNNIREVLYVYDPQIDKFLFVSPSFEKMWEMPVERVLDDPLAYTKVVHPDDQEAFWEAVRREHEEGDYLNLEYRIVMDDDRIKWIWSRNFPVSDEHTTVGISEDITESKKQQHELQRFNEKLEDEVAERTKEIEHLLQQKDDFINQLGHDLKNPLGPFLQLLPVLENHVSTEKDKHLVKVLNRNANYMRNLVKKTIDLAKLNSSKTQFSFEDVSLSDLVNEVIAVNSSLFDNHDVVVENNVSSDCLVHADALHVEEVFTNLFNNAVKYSEDKRWIGIDAVMKDDFVLVSVRDKGVGISEEQLPFLFDEYYKADSSRHDFDSSGLGLSICKRIVEKHGGQIWAESSGIGNGSAFYFTLPISNKGT